MTNRLCTMPLTVLGLFALLFAGCDSGGEVVDGPANTPNILWIVGENFKLDFGIYGAANVHTPNLDSLARSGMRYTRVFATSPVCAPSRSAFFTGMYQTSTDTHNMRSHRDDDFRLPEGVRPLTHWLSDAGYFTANISTIADSIVGTGKLDLNFVNEGALYDTEDWALLKDNQPFFAQINTPEAEYDIYDRQSAEKPRVPWVGEEWHPQIATPENVSPPPYYPDHAITREEWARYLNSVSGMDMRIGWILDQLRADGLADNTIIVFFADNGRLEARGIHWVWDTGLHVPMIIYYPEGLAAPAGYVSGGVGEEVISLLDLTATTLWMAGVPRPAGMQSLRFLGEDADPPRDYAFSARDRIDETVLRLRSVRGPRFHYIRNIVGGEGFPTLNRYKEKCFLVKPLMREMHAQGTLEGAAAALWAPFPAEQLYDTEADPHEINDLASDSEYQMVLEEMRAALDTWMVETEDLGQFLEPDSIVSPFIQEMHDWFGTPGWHSAQE